MTLGLDEIDRLTGGRIGRFDVPCPICSPFKSRAGARRKVMRVWCVEADFATFHCVRCGERGYARGGNALPPDPIKASITKAETAERERASRRDRLRVARRLWSRRRPIAGTPAEQYLRKARGYGGPIPATLAYLPAWREHLPAMIAAFGFTTEPEPGEIAIADEAVRGVHVTKLKPDGSGKADVEPNKIMLGPSLGAPIMLAPMNDLGGLSICEGIEDALSVHEATGLGAWAAGSASRMPALGVAVPDFTDFVRIVAHADPDGQRYAIELARRIKNRSDELYRVELEALERERRPNPQTRRRAIRTLHHDLIKLGEAV